MQIREARPNDADTLTAIAHAAKRHWGYSEELIVLWADDLTVSPQFLGEHPAYVAVRESEILGFYALSPEADAFSLEHMWVDPASIGSGVGAHLFAHAVQTVRSLGGSVLTIASDPNAEGFYRRMGARRSGVVASRPDGRTLPVLTFDIPSA